MTVVGAGFMSSASFLCAFNGDLSAATAGSVSRSDRVLCPLPVQVLWCLVFNPHRGSLYLKLLWFDTRSATYELPERLRSVPRREREFLIDNLLVLTHLTIEMILVDRPCAMGV